MQSNVYSDMGTCFYMSERIVFKFLIYGKTETMTSSTHSCAYSYRPFKKCFVKKRNFGTISCLPYMCCRFSSNFHCRSVWTVLLFLLNRPVHNNEFKLMDVSSAIYAVKAHALLLRMRINVVYFRVLQKLPSRMKLTMKLTMREPASMTTETWSRRVTSHFNSV